MSRLLITAVLVAALGAVAGVWLDGTWREMRRRAEARFEVALENELERPISLSEIAGLDLTLEEALQHIARQAKFPIVVNQSKLDETVYRKKQICLPQGELSLRSVLGILYRQVSIGYYLDERRLVITSSSDAESKLVTRVYPLPPMAAPEQPAEDDPLTWEKLLPTVVESSTWPEKGGRGAVVPLPGAMLIRQSRRVHEHLERFFRQLETEPREPDAEAEYLAAFSPAEQRILAALEAPCSFQCTSAPLYEVIEDLSWKYRIPIVLEQPALEESKISLDSRLTFKMEGATLCSVLTSLLQPLGLTMVQENDVVRVTTLSRPDNFNLDDPYWMDWRTLVFDVRDLARDKTEMRQLLLAVVARERGGLVSCQQLLPGKLLDVGLWSDRARTANLLTALRAELQPQSRPSPLPAKTPAEQRIASALQQNLELQYHNVSLRDVVADLGERTGANIRLDGRVTAAQHVNCDLSERPLKEGLRDLLYRTREAREDLGWCIQDDCLVVMPRRHYEGTGKSFVLGGQELMDSGDSESFLPENLSGLVKTAAQRFELSDEHSLRTFRSLLVMHCEEKTHERVEVLVGALARYRRESLAPRQAGTALTEPFEADDANYPVEDLLGPDRAASFQELQFALAAFPWVQPSPELVAPVPPGGMLVAHTRDGHEELQHFFDELRQHLVPSQKQPAWMIERDRKRQELDLALASREPVLARATSWKELQAGLEQALGRPVGLDNIFIQVGWQEQSRSPEDPPPEPIPTLRQQLARIGVTLTWEGDAWQIVALEEDVRLKFYDVSNLLGVRHFEPAELCGVFDTGRNQFLPTWQKDGVDEPVCYCGWLILCGYPERIQFLERLLAWLRGQPDLVHAATVFEREDQKESAKLLRQLLGSTSPEEQYYLAFLLQASAPPQSGLEDLAARVELLGEDQNSLQAVRLQEVLHRWMKKLPEERLEELIRESPSRLLRSAAIQALVSPVQSGLIETAGVQTIRRLIVQLKLASEDAKEMEMALAGLRIQTTHRTKFDYELIHKAVAHTVETEYEPEPPSQNRPLPWRVAPERYR